MKHLNIAEEAEKMKEDNKDKDSKGETSKLHENEEVDGSLQMAVVICLYFYFLIIIIKIFSLLSN